MLFRSYFFARGMKAGGMKTTTSKFILDQYSTDLTKEASEKKLDPVIGREKEIEKVIQVLLRRIKNNPILLGKAGIGKTAIVEGLAQRIVQGRIPAQLKNKRVLASNLFNFIISSNFC